MNCRTNRLIGLVFLLVAPSVANAQLVRVGGYGGVRVRAPFVAVDVLPFGGGTRVRAPFTAVNTGRYGYGYTRSPVFRYRPGYFVDPYPIVAPVYQPQAVDAAPEYGLPSGRAAANFDPRFGSPVSSDSIDQQLRASADRLLQNLSGRRDDGDIWIDYLQPDQIIAAIDRGESPEQLRPLLNNYIGVTGNGSLSSIWSTGAFRDTYRLLDQWISTTGGPNRNPAPLESEANDFGSSIVEPSGLSEKDAVSAQPLQSADQVEIDSNQPTDDKEQAAKDDGEFDELPAPNVDAP